MEKLATKLGRKHAAKVAKDYEAQDPYYETYQDKRGRTKSRKRAMPQGLTKQEEKILKKVRRRAHYLDKGFSLCGFRFGWTAILGLIPFVGDAADFILGYTLIITPCRKAGIPVTLTERMIVNQAISTGVGFVPLVGDIILAVWKTNSRNALLFEEYLIQKVKEGAKTPHQEQVAAETAVDIIQEVGGGGISKITGSKKIK